MERDSAARAARKDFAGIVPARHAVRPTLAPTSIPKAVLLGAKLRSEREAQGIAVRELARRLGVSPSLVSQIERGLVTPSVGTLWSMTTELGMTMDELFRSAEQEGQRTAPGAGGRLSRPSDPVQRGNHRKGIRLAGGVAWERLTAAPDSELEFLYVKYAAGAESCPEDSFLRHGGKEYAYLLEGRLGVQIGFERYELGPGDSISFDSQIPHRLWAIGKKPAVAIWVIVNRNNDRRESGPRGTE
jgi:transcriptional regulator with XRE-family HTH domain